MNSFRQPVFSTTSGSRSIPIDEPARNRDSSVVECAPSALQVTAFTGGQKVPSARFRVRQYIPALKELGVDVHESYPHAGKYPPPLHAARPFWAAAAIVERLAGVVRSCRTDLTLLQRELISTIATVEPLTRRPRVLDVDDAIFLPRGGDTARRLARLCDLVICGNNYLAERFHVWNPNVRILPTAVDTDRFHIAPALSSGRPSIGWSGTSSGHAYLKSLEPVLRRVFERWPDAVLRVVSDRQPLIDVPSRNVEFVPWSESAEVTAIQSMTAGIMPLEDSEWAKGKCSFKLLTYMSCGIPAVASAVGMNVEVLAKGGGCAARTEDEWVDALVAFLGDNSLARSTGRRGREVVLQNYSLRLLAPRLAEILRSIGRELP
jgi:glycosyltransferase involved in cell wall biosynthesis